MSTGLENCSKEKAWEYMRQVGRDEENPSFNNLYVPVPQKIHRCLNLHHIAKMVLIDIISYMGDNNNAYPPIADIALNCGVTHPTVEKYIKELENKNFIRVSRGRNNSYYLVKNVWMSGYIVMSEILHEYRKRMKGGRMVSDRNKNDFIEEMLELSEYTTALNAIEADRMAKSISAPRKLEFKQKTLDAITLFKNEVEQQLESKYADLKWSINLNEFPKYNLEYDGVVRIPTGKQLPF